MLNYPAVKYYLNKKSEVIINKKKEAVINDQIIASRVRLIDENGKQVGICSKDDALNRAISLGLDLMEISSESEPPVCKILDFGKYRYEKQRQYKLNKKKQHIIHVKEIRIRPNTDDHDLLTKLKKAQKFLGNGDKLKVTVMFRGREFHNRREAGLELLNRVVDILKDISIIDKPADLHGRRLSIILSPK